MKKSMKILKFKKEDWNLVFLKKNKEVILTTFFEINNLQSIMVTK